MSDCLVAALSLCDAPCESLPKVNLPTFSMSDYSSISLDINVTLFFFEIKRLVITKKNKILHFFFIINTFFVPQLALHPSAPLIVHFFTTTTWS